MSRRLNHRKRDIKMLNNEANKLAKFADSAEESYKRLKTPHLDVPPDVKPPNIPQWTVDELVQNMSNADYAWVRDALKAFPGKKSMIDIHALVKALNQGTFKAFLKRDTMNDTSNV